MTRDRRKQTGDRKVSGETLPNARLEDVQNDTDAMTRRGVLRSAVGVAGMALGVGSVAACDSAGSGELQNRELAESRGLTREWVEADEEAPTDRTNSDSDLGMSLSGQEFTASGNGGTAVHSMHIARGGVDLGWYHDLVDVTNYDGPDSTRGKPALEMHHSYLDEGGKVVLLVAENDRGMLASPDATEFMGLIPERIKRQARGL